MSAAAFRARYAAYSLDVLLLAPLAVLAAWPAIGRARATIVQLEAASTAAMDRAFAGGHVALLALVEALRSDVAFIEALGLAVVTLTAAIGLLLASVLAVMVLWFVGFEASSWQATPGKRLLGLRVETLDGRHPGLGRAGLRFFAAAPSWLLLHLGHAMAAWRDDGRALHDLIAGTRVIGARPLPAWAMVFLAAQGAALLLLLLWTAWRLLEALLLLGL